MSTLSPAPRSSRSWTLKPPDCPSLYVRAADAEAEGEVLLDPVGVPLEAVLGEEAVLLVDRQVDDGFGEVGARWAVVAAQDVRVPPRCESPGVGVVERQFVAEAVEQEVVDDVDVLVDALGRLHPVVAAGGTGVHPHDGVLGHVDQCPVEEDLSVGPHDRIVVEVAEQPVVLNVRARVLRRVLLLAVDIAAEVVGGVAGGPRSGVAEEGIAEVVPVVVGLGRVVLDRSTVERLVGVHLGQQHGRGEDLQLVVFGAVVVVRRARHPGVVVLDVEAHAVPVVGLEDAIPVHDQRVAWSTVPSGLRPVLMRSASAGSSRSGRSA